MDFGTFFHEVMSDTDTLDRHTPYPYQQRLAQEPWPDIVDVPTGLGKTAAVTVAWLYKRLRGDEETPRRLIWCLPMRVLVEQTRDAVVSWLERAGPLFNATGESAPTCHVLMGGDLDMKWVERPEESAVLIGTQDMLLSRALMRGYSVSRYRWPMEFALVHHDALWVFDEVQLMGAGLATSAQLEAFRREWAAIARTGTRSLWLSATLKPEWLSTVDFRTHAEDLETLTLSDADWALPAVRRRAEASKQISKAAVDLEGDVKADVDRYVEQLSRIVFESHCGDGPTLVIVNSVLRAQELTSRLRQMVDAEQLEKVLLVHSRFRAAEREAINTRLRRLGPRDDVIVVATQAIEAGIDLTAKRLFTELAPWSSLVQRFGRCNRGGEYNGSGGGHISWIDLNVESKPDLAAPYDVTELLRARTHLKDLASGAPADLPKVDDRFPLTHVLRRADFMELFNTEPDLSGHDVDVSHYLRDAGTPEVNVFWRQIGDMPADSEPGPTREELCPVSIGQLRRHLKKDGVTGFVWDGLLERWQSVSADRMRPGRTVMLRAADGGYDADLGFRDGLKTTVPVSVVDEEDKQPVDSYAADPDTQIGRFVSLTDHSQRVRDEAEKLCDALAEQESRRALLQAALWHDVGKAHEAAQTAYQDFAPPESADASGDGNAHSRLWAKTPGRARLNYRIKRDEKDEHRRHFRHELASALAWLNFGPKDSDHDLVAYLIAAHHGKVRLSLRSMPGETMPGDGRKFARGVWEGDVLPEVSLNGTTVPAGGLRLDVMEMGEGPLGPSWTTRTRRLLRQLGPFRLAWLETLVRLADWRASAAERRVVLPPS